MKTGKEKSHDIYLACNEYHQWNNINQYKQGIESYTDKLKKCHELETKYKIKKHGLIAILRLDEFRGHKINQRTMAGRGGVQSDSHQDGRNNAPGQ